MLGFQLFHVAVELHEALLLYDAHVGGDVAANAVARWTPAEPASVPTQVVEGNPHLPDVHDVEGEMVQVAVAFVHEGHHVVVAVYVKPHAAVAEPVRHPHAQHLRVEFHAARDLPRQKVHVPQLARMPDDLVSGGPRVRRPLQLGLPVRQDEHPVPFGIYHLEATVALSVIGAEVLEMTPGVVGRARTPQFVSHVPDAGGFCGDEFKGERLVVAGEAGATIVAFALHEAELGAPAAGGVFDVGDVQADVVDAAEGDHWITRTGRRLIPLKKLDLRRSGGPMSSIPSTRPSISSKAMRTSSRARWAPRQWWMPPGPNAMCLLGSRPTSNMSGFSKTVSSRLPETSQVVTLAPAGISVSASTVSSVVVRRKWWTAVAQRSISSAAGLNREGSFLRRYIWSG